MRKTTLLTSLLILCILFMFGFSKNQATARPSEPITDDYAEFRDDPYHCSTNLMKIYYCHESNCYFYIYLYNPIGSVAKSWTIFPSQRSGYLYYEDAIEGVWRLQCILPGYEPYWTDAALFHTFYIIDPAPEQKNLQSDAVRHPLDLNIYNKAFGIIEGTTSSYLAAEKIYLHVLNNFEHNSTDPKYFPFRSDLDLLNDLNTYGHYHGVCRSDAVILTAYARALRIPARIILLEAYYHGKSPPPGGGYEVHYFAEFYVYYCGKYQWVPADGDPVYNWFGIYEANQKISWWWPDAEWNIGISIAWWIPYLNIVDDIPPHSMS